MTQPSGMKKRILAGLSSVAVLIALGVQPVAAQIARPAPAKVANPVKAEPSSAESGEETRGLSTWDSCHTDYVIPGMGDTGDIDLGDVSKTVSPMRTKRQNCLTKALNNCNSQAVQDLIHRVVPVGTELFKQICAQGNTEQKLTIKIDNTVGGHKWSNDGYCPAVAVSCVKSAPVCTCPTGWAAGTGSGQVTSDGRCKKLACQPNQVSPNPANGTPIGTQPPANGNAPSAWGFTWGNAFYAWGTTANGGAPTCTGGNWIGYN